MPGVIDWMYHRKGWTGCTKSREFLEQHGWSVVETIDATKVRKGRDAALELARSASTVIVARGKKVVTFDMAAPPDDDTLAAALLGPTGNLKAPTLRLGGTLLVGFGEAAYVQVLG
jgi:hypothetical protein